jgi:anti-sigma regulatory factor (Ser/Thr protein kinase)
VSPMAEHTHERPSDGPNRVDVSVPLDTGFIATLRTVAASLGADAGFSIDEIDDLRLAMSEVVSSIADAPVEGDDRIEASFGVGDGRVAVTITTRSGAVEFELDDLAVSILDSVVDQYDVARTQVTLVKAASEAAAAIASDVGAAPPGA